MTLSSDTPLYCKLHGVTYKLRLPVGRFIVSQWPEKITIGDQTQDSRPNTSTYAQTEFSGGIGINRLIQGEVNADRVWASSMDLSYKGHLVLQRRADPIPKPDGAGDFMGWGEHREQLYAVFGTKIYRYDGASWTASLHTLRGRFNSIVSVDIEDGHYLVVSHEEGVAYTLNGDDWTDTGIAELEI